MNRNVWMYGEPTLDDVLDDPVVHLLMRRDGIGEAEVRAAIAPVVAMLRSEEDPPRLVA